MSQRTRFWLLFAGLIGLLVWAYWLPLVDMAERWTEDPQYSHGYLVPLFAVFLLWLRQREIPDIRLSPSWGGLAILAGAVGLWAVATVFFVGSLAGISFVIAVAGLFVALGGWKTLRWSWQPTIFLGFMSPLPFRFQNMLGGSLQAVATRTSTYILQVFGVPAIAEGNVILINDVRIGIVEACNGLGMLVTFFALATALVFLLRSLEPWLRCVILLSAAPVAVIANVVRITVTGFLYSAARDDWARLVFHDVAGWLMMPLAIGILFAEIRILRNLIVDRPTRSIPKGAMAMMSGLRRKQKSSVVR